jgi:hypothetical protein
MNHIYPKKKGETSNSLIIKIITIFKTLNFKQLNLNI